MSRVFKSDYIQIGTPKPIKNTIATVIKKNPEKKENAEFTEQDIIAENEKKAKNIIDDAKEMYLKIIEEANFEAKSILEKAQFDKENICSLAEQNGYKDGYEQGYQNGLDEAQQVILAAEDTIDFINRRKEAIYSEAEEEVMNLVLEISKKVIGIELTQNKDAILSIIKQGLERSTFKSKLILKTSSEDYEHVVKNKNVIIKLVEGLSELDIISDLSLDKGGCIIQTPSGEINASTNIQFREIEKAFNYVLRNE